MRTGGVDLGRDGGGVRFPIDRKRDASFAEWRHGQSSLAIQSGFARPTTEATGSGPKYRPSKESADCRFMRKTSPSATTRQPCQRGSARPRLSRSRASPTAMASTVIARPNTADGLTAERQNALQERHAARQVSAFGKERRDVFGRPDDHQIIDLELGRWSDDIETDRDARAGVPDQPRRRVDRERKRGGGDAKHRGDEHGGAAGHAPALCRRSQALWRAGV